MVIPWCLSGLPGELSAIPPPYAKKIPIRNVELKIKKNLQKIPWLICGGDSNPKRRFSAFP